MSGPGSDVSAELSDYLEQKGVNVLFLELVEYLLAEKPSNPVQFILTHLVKHYPDLCQIPRVIGFETEEGAYVSFVPPGPPSVLVIDRLTRWRCLPPPPAPPPTVLYDEDEKEEEEDDEEDERRDKPIHRRSRHRRGAFSAPSIEPDDVRAVLARPTCLPACLPACRPACQHAPCCALLLRLRRWIPRRLLACFHVPPPILLLS